MSAAARLRRRDEGAEIVVLERSKYVSFANCGLPYYVGGEIEDPAKLLLHTPHTLKAALNLDVRINSEVTAINPSAHSVQVANTETGEAYTLTYDHLILSPGALASRPPIDGLDSPRVHTLRTVDDALALREASGTRAVVLGAGFIGIEAAEALAQRGFETHLVEYAEHVLPPLEVEMATLVTQELRALGVCVHAGVAARSITHGDDHDAVTLSDGTVLTADVIVLSTGFAPIPPSPKPQASRLAEATSSSMSTGVPAWMTSTRSVTARSAETMTAPSPWPDPRTAGDASSPTRLPMPNTARPPRAPSRARRALQSSGSGASPPP